MSELNEKVEEPQEQPSDRPTFREVSPEQLKQILEAHRKWLESEGKEGERADLLGANLQEADLFGANLQKADLLGANLQGADLGGANLQEANLFGANLQGADLEEANLQGANLDFADLQGADLINAIGLTMLQVKMARNWELAFYADYFLKELGLPPDHNERLEKKLAELEKEKKETGAKP